jgi:hypothetical protein
MSESEIKYYVDPDRTRQIILLRVQWKEIISYLSSSDCVGIRRNICAGCGKCLLMDKNGKDYFVIRGKHNIEMVKNMVSEIKSINDRV